MHESGAKALEFVTVPVELAGTTHTLRKHYYCFVVGQHSGAVHRISEHSAYFIQQIAEPGYRREEAFDHCAGNAGVFLAGGQGITNKYAVNRELAEIGRASCRERV